MGFADEMEQFDDQWDEDREKERPGFVTLRDGKHQVLCTEAKIIENDDSTYTWQLAFQNKDGSIRKWNNLDHEVGRSVAAQDAKMMGYDGKMSGLEEACESGVFNDLIVEINVKTRAGDERDFTNVYINRVLGKGDPADFAQQTESEEISSGSSVADDDIPF